MSQTPLDLDVDWARSSGTVVGDGPGSTVAQTLLLDADVTDPAAVWDSTYLSTTAPPPPDVTWASWNTSTICDIYNFAEGRLFRGSFALSQSDLDRGVLDARLFDPFKPGGEIPINDVLYVYLNGTFVTQLSAALSFHGFSGYGTWGVDGGQNNELAPETEGWFVNAIDLPVGLLVAGANQLDIVTEDVCHWGALGFLDVEVTVADLPTTLDAVIDVKPGSTVNPINLGSNGALPVAVLTTPGFDATQVDVRSILFGDTAGPGRVGPQSWSLGDVDGDGDTDLLLHFSMYELRREALDGYTVQVELTGTLLDGTQFSGTDAVKIVSDSAGLFRNGVWYFDLNGDGQAAEKAVAFGLAGDTPITGDWDGDGFEDIGVFRRGTWYFDLDGQGGVAEKAFAFGVPGDVPIVGDFNGDGTIDVGVFRLGLWYFDLDGQGYIAEKGFAFGVSGDVPIVGDWDGDGDTDVGVFRDGKWFQDIDGRGGNAEKSFAFGIKDDKAAVGDWDGDGDYEVAVVRKGIWYFDLDGAGGAAEHAFEFGLKDDVAFSGNWGDKDNDLWAAGVDAALTAL